MIENPTTEAQMRAADVPTLESLWGAARAESDIDFDALIREQFGVAT